MFAAVLFARARFREIRIVIFQIFIRVAMAELAVNVGIVDARLRRFLLDCPFGSIAIVMGR